MSSVRDLSSMDMLELENVLKERIVEYSNGKWTDFSPSSAGYVMLKLLVSMIDMQNLSRDFFMRETFLPTAKERYSVQSLLELVGYKMRFAYSGNFPIGMTCADLSESGVVVSIDKGAIFAFEENRTKYMSSREAQQLSCGKFLAGLESGSVGHTFVVPGTLLWAFEEYSVGDRSGGLYRLDNGDKVGDINYKTGVVSIVYNGLIPAADGELTYVYSSSGKAFELTGAKAIGFSYFDASDISYNGEYYYINLGTYSYVEGSAKVTYGELAYREVPFVNSSVEEGLVFSVNVCYNDTIEIRFRENPFGDGSDTRELSIQFLSFVEGVESGQKIVPISGVVEYGEVLEYIVYRESEDTYAGPESVESAKESGSIYGRTMGCIATMSDVVPVVESYVKEKTGKDLYVCPLDCNSDYLVEDYPVGSPDFKLLKRNTTGVPSKKNENHLYSLFLIVLSSLEDGSVVPSADEIEALREVVSDKGPMGIKTFIQQSVVGSGDSLSYVDGVLLSVKVSFTAIPVVSSVKETVDAQVEAVIENYFKSNVGGMGTNFDWNGLIASVYQGVPSLRGLTLTRSGSKVYVCRFNGSSWSTVDFTMSDDSQVGDWMKNCPLNMKIALGEIESLDS